MAAIHHRFHDEAIERLNQRLVNAKGHTALWGATGSDDLELGPHVETVTEIGSVNEGQWDTIVCVAQLWRMPDHSQLVNALQPEGRLLYVEPVCGFGLTERAQQAGAKLFERRYGLNFTADVPQLLRAAGLTPTSTDRFRVGGPVFSFVAGEARVY